MTVRFQGLARLRPAVGRYPTLVRVHGHSAACPGPTYSAIFEGSLAAGFDIGLVGYSDLDDDCSEITASIDVDFEVGL